MYSTTLTIAAPVFALCLLAGVWADRAARSAGNVASDGYLQHIRTRAQASPMSSGAWQGSDSPIPPLIPKAHPPNVILSRTYRNLVTGARADVLFVHHRDVRDLAGQRPPGGYVARTWALQSAAHADLQVDDLPIAATRYEFLTRSAGDATSVAVDEFFILPSGRTCRDTDDLSVLATSDDPRAAGVAQMQIVSYGRLASHERDDLTAMFVRMSRPAIDAINQGVEK